MRAVGVLIDVEAIERSAGAVITDRLAHRGWSFEEVGDRLHARKHEWAGQLSAIIDFGYDGATPTMALLVDMASMPIKGERFRDVFNSDPELVVGGFLPFKVRQLLSDDAWAPEIGHNAFLHGAGSGILLAAKMVLFDRSPTERGVELANRFVVESNRFVETGNNISALLQRTYQRTVLGNPDDKPQLPAIVGRGPGTIAMAEPLYPWRR